MATANVTNVQAQRILLLKEKQELEAKPLTPTTGIRLAQLLAKLAMLNVEFSGREHEKGTPGATGIPNEVHLVDVPW